MAPVVLEGAGALAGAVIALWGGGMPVAAVAALFVAVTGGLALSRVDVATMRLPNKIMYPTGLAVAALLLLASVFTGSYMALVWALGCAVASWLAHFVFAALGGMGLGDVKLSAGVAFVVGWFSPPAVIVAVFGAFALGCVHGVAVMVRSGSMRSRICFGPYMIAAGFLGVFAGQGVVDVWLNWAGLA